MSWILLAELAYIFLVVLVCIRILFDTSSTTKTLAYVLVTIFFPFIGMAIYFAVGTNYRKNKLYSKKISKDDNFLNNLQQKINLETEKVLNSAKPEVEKNKKLARLLIKDSTSPLTGDNEVKLLLNGENKFPAVIAALQSARHHIHMEYYIFEDDQIGNQIKQILMEKARAGVKVRFIYDDFGSSSIRKKLVPELKTAGVQAFPFYRILFILFASRINYRNHRKIIVIDGNIGFVGGINVSDRYINDQAKADKLFWRDTHVMITGPGVYFLQYLFICDWNFCSEEELAPEADFFSTKPQPGGNAIVQIAASGPDSETPTIMFSLVEAIGLAEEELLITTPYFIPGESVLDALNVAALSGVKVKLLVPGKSDSAFVDAAARSYYSELLDSGVEVYQYQKGFVHAKTVVSDGRLSIIGTANTDHRSFELNFEVNSIIYDAPLAEQLRNAFFNDLKYSIKIEQDQWDKRTKMKQLPEKIARLVSPLL